MNQNMIWIWLVEAGYAGEIAFDIGDKWETKSSVHQDITLS